MEKVIMHLEEDFSTQDMKNFKYVFKIDKMDKLFSIESDSVFRGGFSFWIVSKKNPNERYLIRTYSNVIEQYIRPYKTGEVKYGDGYDIILTLKHYMETKKLVSYIHGETMNESMQLEEAKQVLSENGYIVENNKHFEFWQYKLEVKKIVNEWIKTQKWYKTFDELRSSISWELYIDIVKETMKNSFEKGLTAEQCADEIIGLAKEASTK